MGLGVLNHPWFRIFLATVATASLSASATDPAAAQGSIALLTCVNHALLDATPLRVFRNVMFEDIRGMIEAASAGKLRNSYRYASFLPWIVKSMERRDPRNAAPIGTKLREGKPLDAAELKSLVESVYADYKVDRWNFLRTVARPYNGRYFDASAYDRLGHPTTERDQIWLELGFHADPDRQGIISPTYLDLAKNLRTAQRRRNVPWDRELGFSFVYEGPQQDGYRYYPTDGDLPPGLNVPCGRRFLSPRQFFDALDQNLMLTEANLHDVGHAVGWIMHPEYRGLLQNLAKKHFADAEDEPLYMRLEWASEALSVANDRKGLLSEGVWKERSKREPIEDLYRKVRKLVAAKPYDELVAYCRNQLIPGYRDRWDPYGGSSVQYGEMANVWTAPKGQVKRFYEEKAPITRWTHPVSKKIFRYNGRGVLEEQFENMGDELSWMLKNPHLDGPMQESRVRDYVARMELAVGVSSEYSGEDLVRLFGSGKVERENSRFAEMLRIVRGSFSDMYRILTE